MTKQQQFYETTTLQVIISVIVLIILIVIFAIQLSIIISYYLEQSIGRCIYKDDENSPCYCNLSTKKTCDDVKGIFKKGFTCSDIGTVKDCKDIDHSS
jgi:hypothetical protein